MAEVLSVEAVLEDGRLVRGAGAARQLRAAPPSQVECRGEGTVQLHARPLLKVHAAIKTEYREATATCCLSSLYVTVSLYFRSGCYSLINRRSLEIF
jgi:hypothetical protein